MYLQVKDSHQYSWYIKRECAIFWQFSSWFRIFQTVLWIFSLKKVMKVHDSWWSNGSAHSNYRWLSPSLIIMHHLDRGFLFPTEIGMHTSINCIFLFRSLKEANITPQEIDCVCYTKGKNHFEINDCVCHTKGKNHSLTNHCSLVQTTAFSFAVEIYAIKIIIVTWHTGK